MDTLFYETNVSNNPAIVSGITVPFVIVMAVTLVTILAIVFFLFKRKHTKKIYDLRTCTNSER